MSRSAQYLNNFSYGPTDRALEKYKKIRMYKRQYEYKKAKMKRKVRMMSILLASGITISVAANAVYAMVAQANSDSNTNTKYTEHIENESSLAIKPTEKINKEIIIATGEKESKEETKQEVTKPTKPKKSNLKIGGDGSDEVKELLNEETNKKYATGELAIDYLDANEDNAGAFIYKYCSDYGVDPAILASISYQESGFQHYDHCPGGYLYNGAGVGFTQQENPNGEKVTAYNVKTGETDVEYITMDNACDIAKNIKIGAMQWQNNVNYFKGNVLLAVQAHNFGQTMTEKIMYQNYFKLENLKKGYPEVLEEIMIKYPQIYNFLQKGYSTRYYALAEEYPENYENIWKESKTYWNTVREMIYKDYSNTSWIYWIKDAYNNPYKYIQWEYEHYGDGGYVKKVLGHCPTTEIKYEYAGTSTVFDLETLSVVSEDKVAQKVR